MNPPTDESIAVFARMQVSARLGKLVFELRTAAQTPDPEAIHNLRVAIRRLAQSLSVFGSLFPKAETKKIRRRLKKTLDLAGDVRDRDIALEFLDKAEAPAGSPIRKALLADRKAAEQELARRIVKWNKSGFSARWRSELKLIER